MLLEAFTPERPRQKLQQLTLHTRLPKTTVLRILRTLVSLNYIRFDESSKEYFLGPKVMSLGYATLSGMDLKDIARPYIEELSRLTGQNVNLGILDGAEVVYVERITKKQLITTAHTVGSRVNMCFTAIGRAILAYLSPQECEKIVRKTFAQATRQGLRSLNRRELREMLREVRRKGYSVSNEEFSPGIRAIAAPIFEGAGMVDAAINMPVFSRTVSLRELTERYAPMLVRTAGDISETRGYRKAGLDPLPAPGAGE